MKRENISSMVVKRLPRYYRFLAQLKKEGVVRISSRELAEKMGITASQIRQDLNCFGGFGQQGYGYNIAALQGEIGKILGLDTPVNCILIGAGNLGRTIATHIDFEERGFKLIGIFDNKESFAGQMVRGLPIRHIANLDDFCRENMPQIAVLCVPQESAPALGDQLVGLGIKGIWNFSHYDFGLRYPDISVENVHLGDSLMVLRYRVKSDS